MRNIGEIWRKNALWIMFLLTIFAIGGANLPNLYNTAKAQYISRSLDTSVAEGTYEDNFWRHEDFANVNHFFTLLGKMFFTPYGKEFFTSLSKQIFTS